MSNFSFPTEPCNRRTFVIATSALVAGGLLSCSKAISPKERSDKEKEEFSIPNTVRVRIGKCSRSERATVGKNTFSRSRGKWEGGGTLSEHTCTVENLKNTKVTVGNVTKFITGTIVLHARDDISKGAFDVIAHVPIEQYLPGVLAGELFAHWHPATFASQAIAARSYVVAEHLDRKNTSHFDVTDGPSSQMFLGDVTLDVAHRAVLETSGIVLVWNNQIVPAYYSACCGGLAATAADAISGASKHDIPPLGGHAGVDACTKLPIHTWKVRRSSRTFRRRLQSAATSLGIPSLKHIRAISSIEPSGFNQHGRPTSLTIADRRKNKTEIRARDFIRAANVRVPTLPSPKQQIWSPCVVGKKTNMSIEFRGVGMGHGVGLCQYGAQELAGQGRSWEEILAWYYPQARTISST